MFTDLIEEAAEKQVIEMASHDITKGSQVRIMPDCLTEDTEVLTTLHC